MKIEILEDLDFPKLGRFYKKGVIEVNEIKAQILLTSPYVKIKQQNYGTHIKVGRGRNRR